MGRETRSSQPLLADAGGQRDQSHVQLHLQDREPLGRQGAREPCAGAPALVLDISTQFMTSRSRSLGHSHLLSGRFGSKMTRDDTRRCTYDSLELYPRDIVYNTSMLIASAPQPLPSHHTTWSFASLAPHPHPVFVSTTADIFPFPMHAPIFTQRTAPASHPC